MIVDRSRGSAVVAGSPPEKREPNARAEAGDGKGQPPPDAELGNRIEAFRGYLLLMARRRISGALAPKVGASDVVQETLWIATRKAADLKSRGDAPVRLREWLEAILVRHLANVRNHFLRTDKRRADREAAGLTDLVDTETSPSLAARRQERREALEAAMQRLPERYQRVIRWRYWDRLSYEEIGNQLSISTDAARKLGGRALLELRALIRPGHEPS